MINISQAFMKPTIFLRYNPDEYKVNGKTIVGPTKNKRLKTLTEWIEYLNKLKIEDIKLYGFCSIIQLFYDDYNESNIKHEIISHFD